MVEPGEVKFGADIPAVTAPVGMDPLVVDTIKRKVGGRARWSRAPAARLRAIDASDY